MDEQIQGLLELWDDYARDHSDGDIVDFIRTIKADVDCDTIAQFKDAVAKLNRIDRRLKQIGVESRDSD